MREALQHCGPAQPTRPSQRGRLSVEGDLMLDPVGRRWPLDPLQDQGARVALLLQPVDVPDGGAIERGEDLRFPLVAGQPVCVGRYASGSTFSTTSRSSLVSQARCTSPMPPSPMMAVTWYEPSLVPGSRVISCCKPADYTWRVSPDCSDRQAARGRRIQRLQTSAAGGFMPVSSRFVGSGALTRADRAPGCCPSWKSSKASLDKSDRHSWNTLPQVGQSRQPPGR